MEMARPGSGVRTEAARTKAMEPPVPLAGGRACRCSAPQSPEAAGSQDRFGCLRRDRQVAWQAVRSCLFGREA